MASVPVPAKMDGLQVPGQGLQVEKVASENAGPRSDYSFMQVTPDDRDHLTSLLESKV